MPTMKTRQKKKDPRVEELLCHEELPYYNDSPFATTAVAALAAAPTETAPASKPGRGRGAKSKAEAVAAAIVSSQQQQQETTMTSGRSYKRRTASKNAAANTTVEGSDAAASSSGRSRKKRKTVERKKPPTVQFTTGRNHDTTQNRTASSSSPQPHLPLDAAQVDALSEHVMYHWNELGLGERSGSGAWNAALRTRLVRSHWGVSSVSQLSSMECLYRVQQTLPGIPTILPPTDSFLVSSAKAADLAAVGASSKSPPEAHGDEKEPAQELATNEDNDMDGDKKPPAKESSSSGASNGTQATVTAQHLRELYRLMMAQDVDDGSALRRDLRFTNGADVCQRMGRADVEVASLETRERGVRERLQAMGLFKDGTLQQRVARMRGIP